MDRRVTIERETETLKQSGDVAKVWTPYATVWLKWSNRRQANSSPGFGAAEKPRRCLPPALSVRCDHGGPRSPCRDGLPDQGNQRAWTARRLGAARGGADMTRGVKPSTILPGSSPVTTIPKTPSYLSKEGKAEWRRVVPILVAERKVLTEAEPCGAGKLCDRCRHDAAGASRAAFHRPLDRRQAQSAIHDPFASAQQQLRAAGELGLTPAARVACRHDGRGRR